VSTGEGRGKYSAPRRFAARAIGWAAMHRTTTAHVPKPALLPAGNTSRRDCSRAIVAHAAPPPAVACVGSPHGLASPTARPPLVSEARSRRRRAFIGAGFIEATLHVDDRRAGAGGTHPRGTADRVPTLGRRHASREGEVDEGIPGGAPASRSVSLRCPPLASAAHPSATTAGMASIDDAEAVRAVRRREGGALPTRAALDVQLGLALPALRLRPTWGGIGVSVCRILDGGFTRGRGYHRVRLKLRRRFRAARATGRPFILEHS
jgi:hypothetical protein